MSTSYFHKISFHYFEDNLMTKLTLGQEGMCKEKKQFVYEIWSFGFLNGVCCCQNVKSKYRKIRSLGVIFSLKWLHVSE